MMSKTIEITERVFEAIKIYYETHGYSPTIREIGREMRMNASGIWRHYIVPMLEAGRLTWPKDQTGRHIVRGIRTVEPDEENDDD